MQLETSDLQSLAEVMAERSQKLAKLNHLRRSIPYTSKSALEKVLAYVTEEGVPEITSRKAMSEASQAVLKQADSSEPLLQDAKLHTHDGRIVAIKYTNFSSWIQRAYHIGGGFHQLLSSAMATTRYCISWSVLMK